MGKAKKNKKAKKGKKAGKKPKKKPKKVGKKPKKKGKKPKKKGKKPKKKGKKPKKGFPRKRKNFASAVAQKHIAKISKYAKMVTCLEWLRICGSSNRRKNMFQNDSLVSYRRTRLFRRVLSKALIQL